MNKAALALVFITAAFGLTMAMLTTSAMIPQAQAFQRSFGQPPGLHKNRYEGACQQPGITQSSNPSPVGQSCRD